MTIICVRDGWIAADSSVWLGEMTFGSKEKIKRLGDGSLIAVAGLTTDCARIEEWAGGHLRQIEWGDFVEPHGKGDDAPTALWLRHDGLWRIGEDGRPDLVAQEFDAEGSHCSFALGCMAMGASAEEAVRMVIKHGAFAREPVVVRQLGEHVI